MKIFDLVEDGRIVKGVNTTVDVDTDEIKVQAAKFGNTVDKDGFPPTHKKKVKGSTTNVLFNLGLTEGYKLQLERDKHMLVLNITNTKTGRRTEVRGKLGYESGNYDPNDDLHQLLDTIGKSANVAELINGEVVTINPKHPDAKKAKAATDKAYNEARYTAYEWALMEGGHTLEETPKKRSDLYVQLENFADGKKEKDYLHGYCHKWALMDIKKNPERVLYARIGFHYDKEYEEVDHIFTVDPKTGKAYDVRGEFANADALLADHDFGADEIDVKKINTGDINNWIADGELKPITENFADGKRKGKSRPGRVKRAGASCNGSVTSLRKRAKNSSGEKARMYHWCANMKSGRKKK